MGRIKHIRSIILNFKDTLWGWYKNQGSKCIIITLLLHDVIQDKTNCKQENTLASFVKKLHKSPNKNTLNVNNTIRVYEHVIKKQESRLRLFRRRVQVWLAKIKWDVKISHIKIRLHYRRYNIRGIFLSCFYVPCIIMAERNIVVCGLRNDKFEEKDRRGICVLSLCDASFLPPSLEKNTTSSKIECDMYAWNMGNSSGKWSSFRTPWTCAIIILWAPVPSCRDALRLHCVPFLHSYFWGIIRWWTILHDHHQAKSLQQQSLFDHNDTYGTQTIADMNCVNI